MSFLLHEPYRFKHFNTTYIFQSLNLSKCKYSNTLEPYRLKYFNVTYIFQSLNLANVNIPILSYMSIPNPIYKRDILDQYRKFV